VDFDLKPQQLVVVDSGNNVVFGQGIEFDSEMGGLSNTMMRMLAGGTLMLNKFRFNSAQGTGRLIVSPKVPAKIIPLNLKQFSNKSLVLQKGSFLCSEESVTLDI